MARLLARPAAASAWIGLLCATLAGCHAKSRPAAPPPPPADWRQLATPDDRLRLRRWRQAWTEASVKLRAANAAMPTGPDALFDPDRALADPVPAAGRYSCRVTKLGANGPAMRDVTRYPPFECRVTSDPAGSMLYQVAGTQRPVGRLYGDTSLRAVFLGTLVVGDETKPLAYGTDGRRDLAGYVERIGPRRWRLVLPYPHFESLLDVVEITPASVQR